MPDQEYELGTVWVPMYLNGQIYMIPIRPKPIQPNPIKPKHPNIDWDQIPSTGTYSYNDDWNPPPPPDGHF